MIGGPSEKAIEAAGKMRGNPGDGTEWLYGATLQERMLVAAHHPALGLDGSICKRDVLEWLRANRYGMKTAVGDGWVLAADRFEREFGEDTVDGKPLHDDFGDVA